MYGDRRICLLIVLSLITPWLQSCKKDQSSDREGRYYDLRGDATGILADFTSVTCLEFIAGNTTLSEPHLEVKLTLGDNEQVGDPARFSTFATVRLTPLPPDDLTRKASVVPASVRADDDSTIFELGFVAAEYEYGVPLQSHTSVWLHRLTIPEQTFVHPRDGEITVSGTIDGLYFTCNR